MIDMSNALIEINYENVSEITEDDLKCKECLISKLGEDFRNVLLVEYGITFIDEDRPS